MNNKLCYFIVLIMLVIINSSAFTCEPEINVERIERVDLSLHRNFFIKSWTANYQNCSLRQLGLSEFRLFLDDIFDLEESEYTKHSDNSLFLEAMQGNQLIGYISFELRDDGSVYLRQLALSPDHCTVDDLRILTFAVLDYVPDIKLIYVHVRHLAIDYLNMFKELGFEESSDLPDLNDLEHYIELSLKITVKCGTCFPGFSDEDFEEDFTNMSAFDINIQAGCGCGSDEEGEEEVDLST